MRTYDILDAGTKNRFLAAGAVVSNSARGVQLQNLSRPGHLKKWMGEVRHLVLENDYDGLLLLFGDPVEVISLCIRLMIAAPEGSTLRVCDKASIETRLVGWESGCEALMSVFAEGRDAYKETAARLFGKSYDDVTEDERQMAKPCTLGGAYRLSGGSEVGAYPDTVKTGLFSYAETMGVKLTKEQAHEQIQAFREAYPEIVQLWYEFDNAVEQTLQTHKAHRVGVVVLDVMPPFLRMKLPSGRYIYYLRPRMEQVAVKRADGTTFLSRNCTYEGYNKARQWTRVPTHGGKFVEQSTQGIARDDLCESLLALDADGFNVIGHAHDEAISEEHIADETHTVARMIEHFSVTPAWAPGLLLGADGFSSAFYRK